MPTVATPNVITDPGYLFWAPLLTAEPANTVVASKFTDAWPAAWLPIGATEQGSEFSYATKASEVMVAEFLDPIRWSTISRAGSMTFAMSNWALGNWMKAVNGGATSTLVSGTAGTALNSAVPPTPGSEIRAMLGWEATTNDARIIMYQCLNTGDIKSPFAKAPKQAVIPCTFNFEVPAAGGTPWKMYSAGVSRA